MKRLVIDIDDDTHKAIKLEAVKRNTTIKDYVLHLMRWELQEISSWREGKKKKSNRK